MNNKSNQLLCIWCKIAMKKDAIFDEIVASY